MEDAKTTKLQEVVIVSHLSPYCVLYFVLSFKFGGNKHISIGFPQKYLNHLNYLSFELIRNMGKQGQYKQIKNINNDYG